MKNPTTKDTFSLAVQNHKKNNLQVAKDLYKEILRTNPNHVDAHNNLGLIFQTLGEFQKSRSYYQKAIQIQPATAYAAYYNLGLVFKELGELQKAVDCHQNAIKIKPDLVDAHNNLGIVFKELKKHQKAISCFQKAIQINPNYVDAHYNLGIVFRELGEYQKAIGCFQKAIKIKADYVKAHNNLGVVFNELGEDKKAISCFQKAIEINSNYVSAHNNLGAIFNQLGELQKAKICFKKAIQIEPTYSDAYWNLHSLASNIDEALIILKKLYDIDKKFIKAKIMLSALKGFKGDFSDFDSLIGSPESNNPYTRSIKWVFSLPNLPRIFFNRWNFFDAIVKFAEKSRPFYEFGVWNGISFRYLINNFKKGFGFDTFTGLPESWHDIQPKGAYSSFGSVPKISRGEFIVGKFEDTLPKFFSKKRHLASVINFDSDLYSSTLCALNYSNKVIDNRTILIFDEFLTNKNWEQDEYKALNEFCNNFRLSYDVFAVSFFSKQVAVKLKKN